MSNVDKALYQLKQRFNSIAVHHKVWLPAAGAMHWTIWEAEKYPSLPECPTAMTDGRSVWINPDFFVSLTPNQQLYLLIHELAHPLLNHTSRLAAWPLDLANIAADFEINNLLDDYSPSSGGTLEPISPGISDAICGTSYGGLAAEIIIDDLLKKQQGQGPGKGSGKGQGKGNLLDQKSAGEFMSSGKTLTEAERKELERQWAEIRQATADAARQAGIGSGGFSQKLERLNKPVITFDQLLEQVMDEIIQVDDGTRTDRRFLHNHDMVIPDDTAPATGTVVFIKDTSGSVSDREARAVMSVVEDSVERLRARRFVVLDVDTEVCGVEDLCPGERCSREFKGRGGTDLRAGFDWVDVHATDARILICFTDGCTPFPATPPNYPVVWIHFGPMVKYPFGDVVDVTTLIAQSAQ